MNAMPVKSEYKFVEFSNSAEYYRLREPSDNILIQQLPVM